MHDRAQEPLQAGERHLRLEWRPGRAEHQNTELICASVGLGQQGRLADTGLAPNQERSAMSAEVFEEVAQQRELALATKQLRSLGSRCEPALTDRRRLRRSSLAER